MSDSQSHLPLSGVIVLDLTLAREVRCETPGPGEHNEEVLNWLGISTEEQARLKAASIV